MPTRRIFQISGAVFLSWLLSCAVVSFSYAEDEAPVADPIAVNPPEGKVPENLVMMGHGENFSKYALIADKSLRTLTVWENVEGSPKFVAAYPMDIGKREGDKMMRDDHRTPEGIYFPQRILEGPGLDFSQYGMRAFPLDYPNFFDRREHKTGSGIWLHAIPETKTLMRGSRGCVVVRNAIIKKLSPMISLKKTPVVIMDKVNYVGMDELKSFRQNIMSWVEKWRASWMNKDIDAYIENYADDFRAMRMDKKTWRRYKQALNDRYEKIEVNVISPTVYRRGNEVMVVFLQDYHSDGLKDFGQKTLYLGLQGNDFKIRGEEWRSVKQGLLANQAPAHSPAAN